MPIKRKKDRRHLIGTTDLKSSERPHYVRVYLWETRDAMRSNVILDNTRFAFGGNVHTTVACFESTDWVEFIPDDPFEPHTLEVSPLIGEIHFVSDDWSTEVIAHEVQHAIIHRLRVLGPQIQDIFEQVPHEKFGNVEEVICYEAGEWNDKVHRWLWKTDPANQARRELPAE